MPPIECLRDRFPGLRIERVIGSGGMGAVYRAVQVELDRPVAVKILPQHLSGDPRFVERFRREAKALAKLDHPNIVRVFDSGIVDGMCYITMELVEGTNLREAMQADAIDPEAVLRIIPAICDGLAYAHDVGIVHRDIKPENILLAEGGKIRIADFGLAKLTDSDPAYDASLTHTGTRLGTPRYMAPEQYDGGKVDRRADIYSLGVVLYEMLTGEVPMGSFAMPSEAVGTDARIDSVIRKTLQRRPDDRYQSAQQLSEELSSIGHGNPSANAPTFGVAASALQSHSIPQAVTPGLANSGNSRVIRYRSKAELFGLPVIDVALGRDSRTGREGIAKGIIAIGDRAVGGLAVGGASVGVVAIGGAAIGMNAFGGAAVGLQLAVGGAAVSGGVSLGGAAIGLASFASASLGVLVFERTHGMAGLVGMMDIFKGVNLNAPEASIERLLSSPFAPWIIDAGLMQLFLGPILMVLFLATYAVTKHQSLQGTTPSSADATNSSLGETPDNSGLTQAVTWTAVVTALSIAAFIALATLNHFFVPVSFLPVS